ncbi:MAG: hypothetical protein AVDCRST_MAG05-718 [uncultured Rubrobacteraceae bacterium]|uniref:Uncharacterized protein n=1 Tax=uncultured Rubrobacteraceae bacterium TaxID=349277 RepID=A0A6J4RPP6_9ACTN|nr:MAG: hypothetical protein AVDCRST_MAG05-718 [uncultured Rubrobacteraceae bacterium]
MSRVTGCPQAATRTYRVPRVRFTGTLDEEPEVELELI